MGDKILNKFSDKFSDMKLPSVFLKECFQGSSDYSFYIIIAFTILLCSIAYMIITLTDVYAVNMDVNRQNFYQNNFQNNRHNNYHNLHQNLHQKIQEIEIKLDEPCTYEMGYINTFDIGNFRIINSKTRHLEYESSSQYSRVNLQPGNYIVQFLTSSDKNLQPFHQKYIQN